MTRRKLLDRLARPSTRRRAARRRAARGRPLVRAAQHAAAARAVGPGARRLLADAGWTTHRRCPRPRRGAAPAAVAARPARAAVRAALQRRATRGWCASGWRPSSRSARRAWSDRVVAVARATRVPRGRCGCWRCRRSAGARDQRARSTRCSRSSTAARTLLRAAASWRREPRVMLAALRALAAGWRSDTRASSRCWRLRRGRPTTRFAGLPRQGAAMADPAGFLNSLGAGAVGDGAVPRRPSVARARHRRGVSARRRAVGRPGRRSFTFLDDEVVYGRERLRELKGVGLGGRLVAAGIQRLEFERRITRDEFDGFLRGDPRAADAVAGGHGEQRQMRSLGIRFGSVGLQGQADAQPPPPETTLDVTLGDEAETFRWLQERDSRPAACVPLIEAEAVVRSLSVAMHGRSAHGAAAAAAQGVRSVHDDARAQRGRAVDGAGRSRSACRSGRSARSAWRACCTTSARSGFRSRC